MTLGQYLKSLRGEKSTRQVEIQTGISNSYISLLENDVRKPSARILKKLSDAYEVPYVELLKKAGYDIELEKDLLDDDVRAIARDMQGLSTDKLDLLKKIVNNFKDDPK